MYSYVVSPSTHKQILYYWTRIVVAPLMMMAACQKRCSRFLFFFLISILFRDKVFVFIFNTYFEHHLFTIIIIIIWHVISSSFLIVVFAQQTTTDITCVHQYHHKWNRKREREKVGNLSHTHYLFLPIHCYQPVKFRILFTHTHTSSTWKPIMGKKVWRKSANDDEKNKKKSNGKMDADHSYTHAPGQWTHRTRKLFFMNLHEQPVYNYNDDDV